MIVFNIAKANDYSLLVDHHQRGDQIDSQHPQAGDGGEAELDQRGDRHRHQGEGLPDAHQGGARETFGLSLAYFSPGGLK